MNNETQIPKQPCSRCGYKIDAASEAYGNHKPRAGGISMCLCCGHATLFTADLTCREPTSEEALKISLMPEIIQAQLARAHVVGDRLEWDAKAERDKDLEWESKRDYEQANNE